MVQITQTERHLPPAWCNYHRKRYPMEFSFLPVCTRAGAAAATILHRKKLSVLRCLTRGLGFCASEPSLCMWQWWNSFSSWYGFGISFSFDVNLSRWIFHIKVQYTGLASLDKCTCVYGAYLCAFSTTPC